ncbi:hypothetical protein HPB47_020003 [Ixodes persulcatus]|uniref:Uncharacterized protein n=1 Tax=Ixodes persulcatus TaxID=34615 RepID=A0AC60QGM3_IXOPE|nr:hypothetical protein HPB47_020003 [Ixodes persulcatus]
MDGEHPERRAYHAKAQERPVATLDPRHVVYYTEAPRDDPHQGYCKACNTLATTQQVIWECPEPAAASFEALVYIPIADQPNIFEDWVIPQDKPPPTVRLVWNQLFSFFYVDGGPAELYPRWPSVTVNIL